MNIMKFFNCKKRNLSNNSNTKENTKRQREEGPDVLLLETPETHGDVFEESLKSERKGSKRK